MKFVFIYTICALYISECEVFFIQCITIIVICKTAGRDIGTKDSVTISVLLYQLKYVLCSYKYTKNSGYYMLL